MSFAKYYTDGRRENAPASLDAEGRLINAGFDETEKVHKVAMLAWNPSTLAWERMTPTGGTVPQTSGGGGGTVAAPKTKRMDQASPETLFIGEADPGSPASASVWRIKRITMSTAGDPVAIEFANAGAFSCSWDDRTTLSYS